MVSPAATSVERRLAPMVGLATTALLYVRVSTEDQAREGVSLDAQVAECRRYAARQGWVLGTEYQDILSGKRDNRPAYQRLLADVRQMRAEGRPAVVVVAALDRFGRRLLERVRCREELRALGVTTHSVREGGEVSDLTANVLAAVAQEEVRRLGERVRASNQHIRALGWHSVGWVLWGYQWRDATAEERREGAPMRVLEVDSDAAPYVREAFQRVAAGEGLKAISAWLTGLPSTARNGRAMGGTNIAKALRNPAYIARDHVGETDVLARPRMRWPALVDDATWYQAQERLDSHRRQPHQATGSYVLTGFLRCPECGERMCGRVYKSDRRYVCVGHTRGANASKPSCRASASGSRVEAAVLSEVAATLAALVDCDPALRAELRQEWERLRRPAAMGDVAHQTKRWEAEAERARTRLRRATDLFVDGQLSKADYDDKSAREQAALNAAVTELERLRGLTPKAAATLPPLQEVLAKARGWAEGLRAFDVPAQRAVLAEVVDHVIPVRAAFGVYSPAISWTALGLGLQALRSAGQPGDSPARMDMSST